MFLHERRKADHILLFLFREGVQIQLIAEGAEIGHIRSGLNGSVSAGLMVRRGRNVAAHGADRIDEGSAVLNLQPLVGIRIVARPGLGRIVQHAGVKASAAAGAGFKQNVREFRNQHFIQPVNAQNVAMEDFPLPVRRECGGIAFRNAAVHIPLHIIDLGFVQDLRQHLIDIVHYFRSCKIQHALISLLRLAAARGAQNPVRMFTEQVRIGVDHLRLDPQAELHSESVHLLGQALDAVGKNVAGGNPIAETCMVAAARAEPAVVQHEHLDSALAGLPGNLHDQVFVEIKLSRFPVVDQNGARLVPPCAAGKSGAVQAVEALAHSVQTVPGIDHDRFGRLEGIARRQFPGEPRGIDAHQHAGEAGVVHLNLRKEITAVDKGETEGFAAVFRGVGTLEGDEGIVLVRGIAADAFHALITRRQVRGVRRSFSAPRAVQRNPFIVAVGQVEAQAHRTLKIQRLRSDILEPDAAGNGAAQRKNGIVQLTADSGSIVQKPDHEGGRLFRILRVNRRKLLQLRLALQDFIGFIDKRRHPAAVFLQNADRTLTVVGTAVGRIFEPHDFLCIIALAHGQRNAEGESLAAQMIEAFSVMQPLSAIQLFGKTFRTDGNDIAHFVILQMESHGGFVNIDSVHGVSPFALR